MHTVTHRSGSKEATHLLNESPEENTTNPLTPPTEFSTIYKEIVAKHTLLFKFMEYDRSTANSFSVSMNLPLGMKVLDKHDPFHRNMETQKSISTASLHVTYLKW
jgi:hypothetical protein